MADKTPEQQQKEMEQTRKDNEERAKKQQEEQRKQQEEQKKREEETKRQQQPGQQQSKPKGSTGKVSTYSATQGEALPTQDPRGDRMFKPEEIKEFAGDLMPGELGWVDLSEEGTPEGPAKRDIPDQDEVVARVYVSPKAAWDDVVTPSGAPITRFMNPEPSLWDEGMRLRNPVPKEDRQKGQQYRQPAGGGVINQPVTA
jgi:Membrane protein involved in colicin uptake